MLQKTREDKAGDALSSRILCTAQAGGIMLAWRKNRKHDWAECLCAMIGEGKSYSARFGWTRVIYQKMLSSA